MMKIHTTQDLNSLVQLNHQSTKHVSSKDFRLKNYSEQMLMPKLSAEKVGLYCSSISFEGKKPSTKDVKAVIKTVNKAVGEIKKDPQPEKKRGDGILNGSFFNRALDVTDYETVATALVAAGACAARGGTILAIPTKKNKEDNMYAAGHAWASGAIGFGTAFCLTAPFKAGSNYVMKELKQTLSEKTLKRLYPHIKIESITNSDGSRKPIAEWLDIHGNKFIDDIKGCEKLPVLSNLADISEKTFEKILNVKNVDWASQKGKSFNDVVTKDGKKLYDEISMSRLGIGIHDEGVGNGQILLSDLNSEYLDGLIKEAKKSNSKWGELDINSVYIDKGLDTETVKDFRLWKDTKGNQWKLDLDEIGVSSPYETADYKPRISGKKRFDSKEEVYKFYSYQKNGKDGKLGSAITDDMVVADTANDGLFKLLTWGPDLLFRIPVAATTIALIPWVLKHAFGLEKSSAKKKRIKQEAALQNAQNGVAANSKMEKSIAFKGKGNPKKANWFIRKFGEWYGKPLIENEKVHNTSKWLSKLSGTVTQHMTVLGSLITSSVYMEQTLTKKELDPERRRTLAINQGLCFIVPTVMAYVVDHAINKWVKNVGYRYTGLKERKIEIDKLENKSSDVIKAETAALSKKIKGIRTLASITIFALIYRYITPVLMTPVANMAGDWYNDRKKAKKELENQAAKEINMYPDKQSEMKAKEVSINSTETNNKEQVA